MSDIKSARIIASASIPMNQVAATAANSYQNGCTLARTAAGRFLLTVDAQEGAPISTVHPVITSQVAQGVACSASIVHTSDTAGTNANQSTWTISTSATLGGAEADIAGQISVTLNVGAAAA